MTLNVSIALYYFRLGSFFYENKLVFSVLGNQPLHDRKHIDILYSLDKDQRHLWLNYMCAILQSNTGTCWQKWQISALLMLMYQVLGPLVSERLVHDYDAMMKLNFRSKTNNSTSSARAKYKSCLTRWRWLTAEASSSTSRYFMVKSTEKELYWFCAKHSPTLKSNTKTTQQTSVALISTQEVDR